MNMKKILLIIILLNTASCYQLFLDVGCGDPKQVDIDYAQWLYNHATEHKVELEKEQIRAMFGCHYYMGDEVFAFYTPEEEGYAPFKVDFEYMRKHNPQVGGYYVLYKDGYTSFSPAEAFETGYERIS